MARSGHAMDSHHYYSESEDDCRNKDEVEQQKKLRSLKLSTNPSLNQSTAEEKSQFGFHMLSSSSSSSSGSSTPNSPSVSSPNYMKTTSSSVARNNNYFQEQQSPVSRPNSKPAKNLRRMSSARFKKALIRKSYGGAETKKKVKQLRGDSDRREMESPVSSRNSKSRNGSVNPSPKSISPDQRSGIMLTRKPSLKPVRKLVKSGTFKSKKYSMEISQFPEPCIEKATCSSALKGSKFPDHVELQPGEERESEKIAAMKVCPYSYCSLHGHSHAKAPPLKRFKSIRKRSSKAQKNKRRENQPLSGAKNSGNMKKGIQASKIAITKEPVAHEMASSGRDISAAVEKTSESIIVDVNSEEASITKGECSFDVDECNLKDNVAFSAFGDEQMGCSSKAGEEMKGDLEEESGSLSRTDSNSSAISLNITANVQEINPKYIRMWHLVYKNVVNIDSGNAENEKSVHGLEKETSMGVENKLRETNSSSFKVLSGVVDQEGADINPDAAYRKLELCKNEAIKLVQEAFDKILLPEIQDQSPRNQDLGEKVNGRIQAEVGKPTISISTSSTYSVGDDLVPDPEETRTKAEKIASVEEKKTIPKVENGSNERAPKRWNNLKKLILFKRFVKALEKVRKIDPRKPQYLPAKPDPEEEKVYLKHQTTDERKNNQEWMLDYALQQVISKLEPAQKKRVSLLIEAFETVLPMPGSEPHIRNKGAVPADALQGKGGLCATEKENEPAILLKKLSNMRNVVKGTADQADNSVKVEQQNLMPFSEKNEADVGCLIEKSEPDEPDYEMASKEIPESVDVCLQEVKDATSDSETTRKLEGTESSSYQEVSVNGKLLKISKRVISRLNTELCNVEPELDRNISKKDSSIISSIGGESDASKSLSSEDLEKSAEISILRSAQLDAGSIQEEFSPPDETKTVSSIDGANEIELEKKNANMWFVIYKHMVSSIDAKDGYEPLVDGIDKEEKDSSLRKQNMGMEDNIATDPNVELQCIEAVKLVNEAIDEIPLPENSNSPRDQLFSVNSIADRGLSEEKQDDGSELCLSINDNSRYDASAVFDKTSAVYDTVSDPNVRSLNSHNVKSEEGERELNLERKPNHQVQKNWSNLKKVILLKRFLKAVEKVKKFNPRQPKFLPVVQDAGSEKVQLRHQDMEDRKNSEEWMLDYALRQAVAELTPARKRKVELLVQAFETVNPTIRK